MDDNNKVIDLPEELEEDDDDINEEKLIYEG